MSDEAGQVEVSAPETEATEPVKEAPSREELKKNGWTQDEFKRAEKHGLLPKEKTTDDKSEVTKEEPQKVDEKRVVPERRNGSLPEFAMTPEQEKVFSETFGAGSDVRGIYFRMKNERQQRQAAEAERTKYAKQIDEMKAELESIRKGRVQPVVDEAGNEIDPEDKPLTVKEWKAMQAKEAEERQSQEEEAKQKGGAAAEALGTQEEYAKSVLPDYDETLKLAIEVRKNPDLLDTKWKRQQAELLWEKIREAAANADKYGIDDLNSALLGYELGKLHPNYGKATNGRKSDDGDNLDPKQRTVNGGLTPEKQIERIANNANRRVSSAAVSGGSGRNTVSADDVTVEQLGGMNTREFNEFRRNHPKQYAKLKNSR